MKWLRPRSAASTLKALQVMTFKPYFRRAANAAWFVVIIPRAAQGALTISLRILCLPAAISALCERAWDGLLSKLDRWAR